MSVIAQTSTALIVKIKDHFKGRLNKVAEHSGQWDEQTIRQIVNTYPAVYVAWLGQVRDNSYYGVKARWAIYIVTKVLNGKPSEQVGAYQIVENLTALLHGARIEPSGNFSLQSVQNLWSSTQSGTGAVVYAMFFEAEQPIDFELTQDNLHCFKIYHEHHQGSSKHQDIHIELEGQCDGDHQNQACKGNN
ncbi:phage protein Gp37 [Frederiksenia canicola]